MGGQSLKMTQGFHCVLNPRQADKAVCRRSRSSLRRGALPAIGRGTSAIRRMGTSAIRRAGTSGHREGGHFRL